MLQLTSHPTGYNLGEDHHHRTLSPTHCTSQWSMRTRNSRLIWITSAIKTAAELRMALLGLILVAVAANILSELFYPEYYASIIL